MEDMILFNGRSSTDFEMIVTEYPVLSRGVRRGDAYQIAGRNGTEVREDDTFENYTMTYKVAFPEDRGPSVTTAEIARWLLGSSGFCRLEDTFEPDFYRLARYAGPLNVSQLLDKCGETPLAFDCQPERFLKTGETARTLFQNLDLDASLGGRAELNNPCAFTSRPVLRITARNEVRIIKASTPTHYMDLVLDFGNTEKTATIDCNKYSIENIDPENITYKTKYPMLMTLTPGNNQIGVIASELSNPGYISKFEIIPRWWTV